MELELGLKITRTREDVSSSVDFRFSKDPFGPLVLSRETDSRFIIIIHLKGFKKEGIEIDINKEGDRITIRGRKPVEEMIMIRWMAWRKEVELRAFRKVFLIPDVVDLDKIKARFDDDDATLTITMPKRVKGISGFKLEEEEEERVEFGDVSEVEEEDVETEKSDEHSERSEAEIQREEEFGETMEDQEREGQVLGGEEKGFRGGLDEVETDTEDDNLEKIQQINEQDKISEFAEAETVGQEDLPDSVTESEDSSLRKLPEITEQENNQEVMKKQASQVEAISDDDTESKAVDEEQEPDELDRTSSKRRVVEKKMTDGDDDDDDDDDDGDGASKVHGMEEPHRRNKESKIQEMVEGKGREERNMETKNGDSKEDVDAKMGEALAPSIDRTQVVGEDDIAETEAFDSDEPEADEVDKKQHELVEKKEEGEENAKVRRQSENSSSRKKPQETEEQHSKAQKRQEKTSEVDIRNDVPKPDQEIEVPEADTIGNTGNEGKEGKEKKKNVTMEKGKGLALNIAETETKAEEFEFDKQEADEIDKKHELIDKKEESGKVGAQSEDIVSLIKPREIGEEEFQGQNPEKKTEFGDDDLSRKVGNIERRDLDATEEADAEMGEGFTPKISETETKHKLETDEIRELAEKKEEAEENAKVRRQNEDSSLIKKLQETEEQQFQKQKRNNKQEKINELVEEKTLEAETNIARETPKPVQEIEEPEEDTLETCEEQKTEDTKTKEQESYRPRILMELKKIQELPEEKTDLKSRRVEQKEQTAERKTDFSDDDDMARKVRDSDAMKGQEEKDKIQELVMEEKVSDGGKGIMAVAETIAESDKSRNVQEVDQQHSDEEDERGYQFQEKLIRGENIVHEEVEDVENEKKTTEGDKISIDSAREAQKIERKESDLSEENGKGDTVQDEQEEENEDDEVGRDRPGKITGKIEQESVNLNNQLEQDNVENGEKTQELVEEKIKQCKEEESETKTNDATRKVQGIKKQVEEKAKYCKEEESETETDDVVRKVQGIKEQDLYEPKRDHASKIKELVGESEIEAECGGLSKVHGSKEEESHESNIHKERDETRINGTEEPSGQEKEKVVESITEKDSSTNVQEIKEERPEKPESHEKQYKVQEVEEAEYNDRKEEQQEGKIIVKAKLETEEDSSRKVQEIENQEYDESKRPKVQAKMQETEEKDKARAMEEIVERRKRTEDGSLRKFQDDEDPELRKPYKKREEGKIQELVEMKKSDHREKVKKQDGSEILRSQGVGRPDLDECERHNEQRNIPEMVEEEKGEKIAEQVRKMDDDSSGKFHEFEERKSYEDWTHDTQEKRKDFVEDEETGPKDKHTGGEEEQKEKVIAKAELKTVDDSSKKVQEFEKQSSMMQDKMQETEEKDKTTMGANEIVERRTKTKDGSMRKEESEEIKDLVKKEATDPKDKGKGEHEGKRYEKVAETKTKVENEINKKIGKNKEPESDKQEGYRRLEKSEGASDRDKEEEKLVDNFTTEIQETEKEESEIHEIVQYFVEDETRDQEDEKAAVVENNEKDSSRKLQTMEENNVPKISDSEATKQDEERVAEKEKREQEAHVKELEGKTEECKDDDGEKGKKGKTVERKNDDCIVRKIQEAKMQESSEKKEQEPEEKIEEPERKETSNQVVAEDDSLRKGQEISEKDSSHVSKRRAEEQEKIQQLKEVETKANNDELEENEIRKPMEEKSNAPENENEKKGNKETAEDEMQDMVDRRIKDQEIQEPYELLENTDHGKIHREEEKGIAADRDIEGMKRKPEDVTSIEKTKGRDSDGLEKHRKLSEIQEKQSVEEKIQEHREEEINEGGGYKKMLKTISKEDSSQSEFGEEKGSDQPERDEEQELMAEEEGKEGEQKAKMILQVESKDDGGSSKENETERLRGETQKEDHQELVETETSNQRKEEKEKKVVGKAETNDECESSSKIQEHEEGKLDKVERHGEEKMSGSLAKEEATNNEEENREGAETQIRDVDFEDEELPIVMRHREQEKKQSFVEKDTSGKSKGKKNQETESRDDNSRKTQENEKQESHEQKRNYEEKDKKNLGQNCCRNEECGKEEEEEISEADVPGKSKGVEKRQSTEIVEKHGNKDNIKGGLVEDKMKNQGGNKKSMITEVLEEAEDHESKGPETLRKQDKSRELVQRSSRHSLRDKETAKTETKSKDNESMTGEEESRKEQGRIKELVEDRTRYCREKQNRENESEDGNSKKSQEIEKEESTEPRRDEIQEPMDRETSEDDEEELQVEYEDSEEDWEAEIYQETGSDSDDDKIRQIRRIKLGFRLVGGSAFFMSLIVIVIRFVRSKRKIRCYKF